MKNKDKKSKSSIDNFESPDFYNLDDLLTQEHIMIRNSIRDFVKKEISPLLKIGVKKLFSIRNSWKNGRNWNFWTNNI